MRVSLIQYYLFIKKHNVVQIVVFEAHIMGEPSAKTNCGITSYFSCTINSKYFSKFLFKYFPTRSYPYHEKKEAYTIVFCFVVSVFFLPI